MTENEIAKIVVDCCFKIHTTLGPGLFESVYEEALKYEFEKRRITFEYQKTLPVFYEDIKLELGFRADLIVEGKVILELKSQEILAPVHSKQLLTYLRITGLKLGLLINFWRSTH